MKGTVTDDLSGVSSVSTKLARYDGASTTYWNGAAWMATDPGYVLTPTLAASGPGVLSTTWSLAAGQVPACASGAAATCWNTGTFLRSPEVPGFWSVKAMVATSRIVMQPGSCRAIAICATGPES